MKSKLMLILAAVLLAGCAGLVTDAAQSEDGCILYDSVRDRSGLAGGPEVEQLVTRVKKEDGCVDDFVYDRDTFAGRGTMQGVAETLAEGGVGILIQREQKPLSTHDGDITTVNQGGSAAAGSQLEAETTLLNNNNEVFCYEECQE